MSRPDAQGWRALLGVALGAALTLFVIDCGFWIAYPPHPLRQVDDALAELDDVSPDVLVLSSSHGRSFHVLGRELERRTAGDVRLVSVPLEGGHMRAMSWVLTSRIGPALDRRDARPSELIFGITWWDSCRRGGVVPEFEPNVVSRAWTFGDYLDNVMRDGMTNVNRNYASYRWQQLLSFSSLAHRRGVATKQDVSLAHLTAALRLSAVPGPQAPAESALLRRWRTDIETGHACLFSPSEMQALAEVVRFAGERQMALTVVLFPLKPATVTESGRVATLEPFSREMRALAERSGFRLVDLTYSSILGDDDFMADFDHVTAHGNLKFADWALAHGLGFLLELKRSTGQARHAQS